MVQAKFTSKQVHLRDIAEDFSRNVREFGTPELERLSYDDPGMRESLKMIGLQTTVKLENIKGQLFILQGNRRIHNLKILEQEKAIDPKTGKPFSTVQAEVYEELDEGTRLALIFDHGSMRTLNKVEMYHALCKFFNAGYSERDTAVMLNDLLFAHYPPSRKIKSPTEDKGQDLLNNFRGVIQTQKMAWQSPRVLENAYIEKLRGNQKWPTNKEVAELATVHKREIEADKTGKISRINPGPEFTAKWEEYLAKIKEATENGESGGKSRPQSMMNRTTVEKLIPALDSRFLKGVLRIILRDLSQDGLPRLDKMLASEIEPKLTDQQKAVLDLVFGMSAQEDEGESEGESESAKGE